MISMFGSGEEFPPFPFTGLLLFYGSSFGSSDSVLHSLCGRSHSPCFGLSPFVESEVTHEEFPPNVVSPRTYFRKTYLGCCLIVEIGRAHV